MLDTIRVPEASCLTPKILVFGVGGGGCNAVSKMQKEGLSGVEFVVANTDAQSLTQSGIARQVQLGIQTTKGLGAGANPDVGKESAEEAKTEIAEQLDGAHMCFVTAGMGGGTGTGAAPIVAELARDMGILTVGVVTKPFHFEGENRLQIATLGVEELRNKVHTLVVLPNQNLFKVTNDSTPIGEIFQKANQVLYKGIKSITDLMVNPGLINLDFADVKAILSMEGTAIMGTGEAEGEKRAKVAATNAMDNQLLEDVKLSDASGVLINVIGGNDMTLLDLQDATETIRQNINNGAKIIVGSVLDTEYDNMIKVTLIATGLGPSDEQQSALPESLEMDIVPEPLEPIGESLAQGFAASDPRNLFETDSWPQDYEDGDQFVKPLVAEDNSSQPSLESGIEQGANSDSGLFPRRQYVAPRSIAPSPEPPRVESAPSDASTTGVSAGQDGKLAKQPEKKSLRSVLGRMANVGTTRQEQPPSSEPRLSASQLSDSLGGGEDVRHIPAFIRRQAN